MLIHRLSSGLGIDVDNIEMEHTNSGAQQHS
jgi:hypothetical protein